MLQQTTNGTRVRPKSGHNCPSLLSLSLPEDITPTDHRERAVTALPRILNSTNGQNPVALSFDKVIAPLPEISTWSTLPLCGISITDYCQVVGTEGATPGNRTASGVSYRLLSKSHVVRWCYPSVHISMYSLPVSHSHQVMRNFAQLVFPIRKQKLSVPNRHSLTN